MKQHLQKLAERLDLSRAEAASAMRAIMEGNASTAQIGAFLIALKIKGEHVEELAGFVEVMREFSLKVRLEDPGAVDLCGTGGDARGTFNISTVASFVVAGTGVTVAKHGNRSISSACGSADVLRELGVNIELSPGLVEACINEVGIGFLFAPLFHPAMRHAAAARAELGTKTCFNMLGPLTNPAGVRRQLVGVYSLPAAALVASVFAIFEPESVMVVHSSDGLDEISLDAPTTAYHVTGAAAGAARTIPPESFGLPRSSARRLGGGDAAENARIALAILGGALGPERDVVLANAAAAIQIAGRAASLAEAVSIASESVDSGRARAKLDALREHTSR